MIGNIRVHLFTIAEEVVYIFASLCPKGSYPSFYGVSNYKIRRKGGQATHGEFALVDLSSLLNLEPESLKLKQTAMYLAMHGRK